MITILSSNPVIPSPKCKSRKLPRARTPFSPRQSTKLPRHPSLEPRFPLATVQSSQAIDGSNPVFPSPKYKTCKTLRARTPFRQGLVQNCAYFLLKSLRLPWAQYCPAEQKVTTTTPPKITKSIIEQIPCARWPLRLSPGPFLSLGSPCGFGASSWRPENVYRTLFSQGHAMNFATKMVLEPRFPPSIQKNRSQF